MASARRIPEATVARLPVYLRVLAEATEETISSDHLAARAGVNAAQVRKDLSQLGSYGTRGVGYDVAYLIRQINRELGLSTDRRGARVGAWAIRPAPARARRRPGRVPRLRGARLPDGGRLRHGSSDVRPAGRCRPRPPHDGAAGGGHGEK